MSALVDNWLMAATGSRVRDFYETIGVNLPDSGGQEVSVSCFANPGAHTNGDKSPSCSVNMVSGQFCCHGCGVKGNPYAAALAFNYTPQRAAELARAHGLFINDTEKEKTPAPRLPDERQILKWRNALLCSVLTVTKDRNRITIRQARPTDPDSQEKEMSRVLLRRLRDLKGWTPGAIARCGLGWDGERITFTIRDKKLKRVGIVRYLPGGSPKVLAMKGSKRLLFPPPEIMSKRRPLYVVEGEPAAVSVRSCGLQCVGIPGTQGWRPEFAQRLMGFRIVFLPDCDQEGRGLAQRVFKSLPNVRVVDIDPSANDKTDVGDWIAECDPVRMRRVLEGLAA